MNLSHSSQAGAPAWSLSQIVLLGTTAASMSLLLGTLYSFPVLSIPIAAEFAQGRGAIAAVFSVRLLAGSLGQAVLGNLVDRFGPRWMGALGASVLSASFYLIGRVSNLGQLYLLFGFCAAFGATLLELAVLTTLNRNFPGRRGMAVGITWGGGGFGIFVLAMLAQLLVERSGWRSAYAVLGLLIAGLVPLVLATFRQEAKEAPASGRLAGQASLRRQILASPTFWLLFLGNLLVGIFDEAVYQHSVPFARHLGYSGMAAASALSLASFLYIPGQIVGGMLSDRLGREKVTTGACALVVAGTLLLLGLAGLPPAWLQIAMMTYGFGLGACIATRTASWGDIYEGSNFAAIAGLIWSAYALGGAFISWFGGWVFDASRSYAPTFSLAIVAAMLWCAILWFAAPRRFHRPVAHGRAGVPESP